ncbi:MAG: hypothetical protein AAF416_07120 [Pseudomonadota bacterium]
MAYRKAIPDQGVDSGAQVAELIAALQTQEALIVGALIVGIAVLLMLADWVDGSRYRRPHILSKRERMNEFRAMRARRSQRIATATMDYS